MNHGLTTLERNARYQIKYLQNNSILNYDRLCAYLAGILIVNFSYNYLLYHQFFGLDKIP